MATQNLILSETQSALINSGRQQVATQAGDFWRAIQGRVTPTEFFTMATEYNSLEAQIDDTIDSGFLVFETYGGGVLHGIGKAPNRPKPPTS